MDDKMFERAEILMDRIAILKKSVHELTAIEKKKAPVDITLWQFRLMMLIYRKGEMNQRELAGMMHISPATLSVGIQRLENAGFLKKQQDSLDKRNTLLTLTDGGIDRVIEGKAVVEKSMKELLDGFENQELEQMVGFVSRLEANIKRIKEDFE